MMFEQFDKWRERWVNLHPLVRLCLAVVAIGAAGWFGAKPAYHACKYWWHGRQLAAAHKALEQGDMETARDLSQTVLRAGDPRVLEALRVLEQSLTSLRDPQRAEVARALLGHPQGSDQDRLRGFRVIAAETPLGWAGQAWMSLPETCRADPAFALPFADRLLAGRHPKEAVAVVMGTSPENGDWEAWRRLILALILSSTESTLAEAHRKIDSMWPAGDQAQGLELLEAIPVERLKPGLLTRAAKRLDPAVAREALMLARLDFAATMSTRAAVIDRAVSAWRNSAPLELARFLQAAGLHRRLLEEFSPDEASRHPGMLEILLAAGANQDEWQRMQAYLDAGAAQLDKLGTLAWRCAILDRLGDSAASETAWREAGAEAPLNPESGGWLRIAGVMRQARLTARANQALYEAVVSGRGRLPLFSDLRPLMESLAAEGREKALIQICGIYLLFEPGNPVLVTHYAYLACVTGAGDPATIAKALSPVAGAYPEQPHIQCVLAAVHLACGNTAEAGRIAATIKVPTQSLPPGYQAAILAASVQSGNLKNDDPAVRELPWTRMMPAERRFFSRFLPSWSQ